VDLSSKYKEADIFLTQQALHVAKEDPESSVFVVSDDSGVFVFLLYFYALCVEKQNTILMLITSRNIDYFQYFVTAKLRTKFATK